MKILNYISMIIVMMLIFSPALHAAEAAARARQLEFMHGTPKTEAPINTMEAPIKKFSVSEFEQEERPKTSWWGSIKSVSGKTYTLIMGAIAAYTIWLQLQGKREETYQTGMNLAGKAIDRWQPGTQPQGPRKETMMGTRTVPPIPASAQELTPEEFAKFQQRQAQQARTELTPQEFKKFEQAQQQQALERGRRVSEQRQGVTIAQRAKAARLNVNDFEKFIKAQDALKLGDANDLIKEFKEYQKRAYSNNSNLSVDEFLEFLEEFKIWEEGIVRKYQRYLSAHDILKFTALEKQTNSKIDAEMLIQQYLSQKKVNPGLSVDKFLQLEVVKRRAGGIMQHLPAAKL